MLKKIVTLLLITSNVAFGQADSQFSKNRFFVEILGHGGFGSLNYEKNLVKLEKEKSQWTFRSGISFLPGDKNSGVSLIFPNSINFLYGQRHMLELGIGEVLTLNTKPAFFIRMMPVIGYRYMSKEQPIFFKITYTPFISHIWDFKMDSWGGISLGYQFK